jgi:DNA-binding beta-propeller fold protein YncE
LTPAVVALGVGLAQRGAAQHVLPTTPIAARAVATLKVPGYADFLAADGRSVWATNEGRIELLHADSALPVATIRLPEPCGAPTVAYGSVWVGSCEGRGSVYRIRRGSHAVEAIVATGLADLRGELSVAAGDSAVWVLSDSQGVLSRIDPASNRVVARIPVAPHSYAAVFGFGSVWLTNTGHPAAGAAGAVQRVDPRRNRVIATIPVGPTPRFLAAGEGAVWTLNQGDGTVTRVDPHTNAVSATIAAEVAGSGGDIATGLGAVWVRAKKILLSSIDPRTNRITQRFGPAAGSGAVRIADDLVWVTAHDSQVVWALRP